MKKKTHKKQTRKKKNTPALKKTKITTPSGSVAKWVLLLILLGSFLLYLPCLDYGFVFDDDNLVERSTGVKSTPQASKEAANPFGYRPVRDISYALDNIIGGGGPLMFHLSNLIYHMLVLIVFWLILREITGKNSVVFCALALFAVHPVHLDAVAYISGRRDILSALFALLAFWIFLRYRKTRRLWLWAPLILCFLLAYLSKEMGIVVPIMILLYEWLDNLSKRTSDKTFPAILKSFGRTMKNGIWYYAIMIGFGAVLVGYTIVGRTVSYKFGWWGGNIITNFLTVAKVFCYYIFIMIAPITLRADYSYDSFPISFQMTDIAGIAALIIVPGVVLFLIRLATKGHFQLPFWALWFFALLLPVAHIVPHHELLAEHYLYLPSMGFCVAVALGLVYLYQKKRNIAIVLGITIGIFWGTIHLTHIKVYSSDMALVSDVLEKAPDCVRANIYMGQHYLKQGDLHTAKGYFRRITNVQPIFEKEGIRHQDLPEIWNRNRMSRKNVSADTGNFIEAYHKLYRILLDEGKTGEADRVCAEANEKFGFFQNELGKSYAEKGYYEEAVKLFTEALTSPMYGKTQMSSLYYNLGTAYLGMNQLDEAKKYLLKSLEKRIRGGNQPHLANAHFYLASILLSQGGKSISIHWHFQQALKLGLKGTKKKQAQQFIDNWCYPIYEALQK